MTKQANKSVRMLAAGISLLLVVAIAAAIYIYQNNQQQQSIDSHVVIDQGIAQFRAGEYEQSLQTLNSIPEGSIEDWHLPYYKGSALIKLKDYASGAAQLELALTQNPREKNTLFALGVAYYKLGNLSLSKAYFAAVLEIDPGHEEAKGLMDIMASLERQQPDSTDAD